MVEVLHTHDRLVALQNENHKLLQDVEELQRDRKELMTSYQALQIVQSSQPTRQQIEELQQEVAITKKAKEELQASFDAVKNEHQLTKEEGERMAAQELEAITKRYHDLSAAYERLKMEHEKVQVALMKDAQSSSADVDTLRKRVAVLEAENAAVHDTAREEAKRLRDELQSIMVDVEAYKASLTEKERLQNEMECLKEKLSKVQQEQQTEASPPLQGKLSVNDLPKNPPKICTHSHFPFLPYRCIRVG